MAKVDAALLQTPAPPLLTAESLVADSTETERDRETSTLANAVTRAAGQ